jgi:hypothetical protein
MIFAGLLQEVDFSPLSGATVMAPGGDVQSDYRGHFEARTFPGDFSVRIRHPGGTIVTLRGYGGQTNFVYRFGEGNPAFDPTVMPTQLTVTGTISDPSGAPAAGVSIVSPRSATSRGVVGTTRFITPSETRTTDAAGHYSITYDVPRTGARAPGFRGGNVPVNVTPAQTFLVARDAQHGLVGMVELDNKTTNVNLRLGPGLTVSGTILDGQTSQPLTTASVQVNYSLARGGFPGGDTVPVDSKGAFQVTGLPEGVTIRLHVSSGDAGYNAVDREVGPPDTATNQLKIPPITLKSLNLLLAGIVQTEGGAPIPNATLSLRGPGQVNANIQADVHGHFEAKVSDGPVYLTPLAPNRGPTQSASGGTTNLVIIVPNPNGGGENPAIATRGDPTTGTAPAAHVRPQATIRNVGLQPRPTWATAMLWPSAHHNIVVGLGVAQLLVLASVAGGVFWLTRRSGR